MANPNTTPKNNMEDQNTTPKKRFSFKNFITTIALASTLLGVQSCADNDNIAEPEGPKVEWIEGKETPIEGVIKIRDILKTNTDIRAYLGTRNADHYAKQLEKQLNLFGENSKNLGDILVEIYNELNFSSNAARLGEDDPRPKDARALREMIAKLLNYIPNNGEIIIGGDRSNAGATTTFDEAGKKMA